MHVARVVLVFRFMISAHIAACVHPMCHEDVEPLLYLPMC